MKDLKPINAEQEPELRQAQKAQLMEHFDLLSEQGRLDLLRIAGAMAAQNL